jgi:hypothetical protein
MELTNFHLGRKQKTALRERARAKGTNVAEEIRNAVDAYLSGVSPEELDLLEIATRKAQSDIAEMVELLDATNRKADEIFAQLERLRGSAAPGSAGASAPKQPGAKRGSR